MLSQKAIEYFKENGYSFEEIEGIKLSIEQANKGEVISMEEMELFVKTELFSKYKMNV